MNLKKVKDSTTSYEVVYKDPVDGTQQKETFSSKGAAEDFADNLAAGTFKINEVKGKDSNEPYEIKPLNKFDDGEVPYPYYFEGMPEGAADVVGMTKKEIEDYLRVFF